MPLPVLDPLPIRPEPLPVAPALKANPEIATNAAAVKIILFAFSIELPPVYELDAENMALLLNFYHTHSHLKVGVCLNLFKERGEGSIKK